MFGCIYGRSVSETLPSGPEENEPASLVDLAFSFSPLVEKTSEDTVVFDVSGQDLLFGAPGSAAGDGNPPEEITVPLRLAKEISRQAGALKLKVNVAIAANPDAAIHAARAFTGATVIPSGAEASWLGKLSIKRLDHSLAGVEDKRAADILETFALWGVRTFADLAELPLAGVAERLGQEGLRLKELAQGRTERPLNLVRPPIGFEQSLELEHPISELEPLSFILSRLLNQICANLSEYALATNELKLSLRTEETEIEQRPSDCRQSTDFSRMLDPENPTKVGTLTGPPDNLHERTITLPVPMRDPKTFLRLLLLDIESQPPPVPITIITVTAQPVKPHARQKGLFIPLAPEPEKLEITLARLAKLVGKERVGSPEIIDTHRPDAFRMTKFRPRRRNGRNVRKEAAQALPAWPLIGFRVFRPALSAEVQIAGGQPRRIDARGSQARVCGRIACAAGPWRASGDWWRPDVWARDEWDVAVMNTNGEKTEVLCRIYRDLISDKWFLAGIYD